MNKIKTIPLNDISNLHSSHKKGSYGDVFFADLLLDASSTIPVALKKYSLQDPKDPLNNSVYKEVLILNHLNNYVDKVVRFYGVYYDSNDYVYIVLERLDMSMFDAFTLGKKKLTKKIIYDLVQAYNEIAKCGIIINDIKPANIMFKGDEIRIIDFGIAEFYGICPLLPVAYDYICTEFTKAPDSEDKQHHCNSLARTVFKTIDAPNSKSVFNDEKSYVHEYCKLYTEYGGKNIKSYVSDTWSFACTILNAIYMELTKQWFKPYIKYDESTERVRIFMFINDEYEITKDKVDHHPNRGLGEGAYDMLSKMLIPEMDKRLSFKEALQHPYFANQSGGSAEIFTKMLTHYLPLSIHTERQLEYMNDIHNTYKNQTFTLVGRYSIGEDVLYNVIPVDNTQDLENIDVLLNAIIQYRTNGTSLDDIKNYARMYSTVFASPIDDPHTYLINVESSRNAIENANVYPFWTHISTLTVKLMKTMPSVSNEILVTINTLIKPEVLELLTIYISLCKAGTYNVWDLTASLYLHVITQILKLEPDGLCYSFDITKEHYDSNIRNIPSNQVSGYLTRELSLI